MASPREQSFWEALYRKEAVENMPWYSQTLDPDFAQALEQIAGAGARVLDLGTGPGTQAVAMAKLGLNVTATDISASAIEKARALAVAERVAVDFEVDDILNTALKERFAYIFDRGCFHVLPPDRRDQYAAAIQRLMEPNGLLVLKCFSAEEPGDEGPYRFTAEQIKSCFDSRFKLISIDKTVFQAAAGQPERRALLCRLRISD